MAHFIVNICGGFEDPDGEHILEGLTHSLDPRERWVAKAIHFRHLVETNKKGVPLSRAPSLVTLPSILEEEPQDSGLKDEWLKKLMFG